MADTDTHPDFIRTGGALDRQLEAMAEDRGLSRTEIGCADAVPGMPSLPPTAFAAITAIFDCLFEADQQEAAQQAENHEDQTDPTP